MPVKAPQDMQYMMVQNILPRELGGLLQHIRNGRLSGRAFFGKVSAHDV